MHKSNLIELLKIFTAKEFKEFGDFVKSPFYNKNDNVINLYAYIKKYFPDLDNENLEKEKVYAKLTGKNDYNDGFMRTIIFNLNKLAEDYLSLVSIKQIEKDFAYLNYIFNDKGADKIFEKKFRQVSDTLSKEQIKDYFYYYCLYRLQGFTLAYNSKTRAFLNKKDFHAQDEINALDSLLTFYLLSALPEYRFFYNQAHVVNLNLEFSFLDEIISFLKRSGFHKKIPELNLFFNELLLVKEGDEKYFFAVKEIAMKEIDKYGFGIKFNTIGLLANTAITQYYNGNDKFLNERFEIYSLILEKGLYKKFEDSYFDDMLFKNIVATGLQLNKMEWTENFIKEYIDKLNPEDRENSLNLNLARLTFYKKDYDTALNHLAIIKNVNHIHYKTEIKILTLMIFYEQGKNDEVVSVIDSYRHFLSNDTLLPDNRKERNYNFLRFVNELIKAKESSSLKAVYDLEHELKITPNTYEKEWLKQKTIQLSKQFK
ncbi:MAG: hypothetical protein JST55_05875 [Bacteroidetes bacterium]|nr:hypothetical protein [Bacteroidota bacterium]